MEKKGIKMSSNDKTTLSLSLSVTQKKALQKYAIDKDMTAAAVVQGWIDKYCVREDKKQNG